MSRAAPLALLSSVTEDTSHDRVIANVDREDSCWEPMYDEVSFVVCGARHGHGVGHDMPQLLPDVVVAVDQHRTLNCSPDVAHAAVGRRCERVRYAPLRVAPR